ncbi:MULTISPECIES: DUF4402 domain-containing protein [unclassified Iodidimonas]|jgi:hypothetical protein|uniref:DUF4402 domain-containing protein n=1 Tax=unclassified Iodidimonas TaxID=2626145 RepID=UPI002482A378|nr:MULTISPECIES: DUF4402 domain-containing protein [unclassified Iodidimonas]
MTIKFLTKLSAAAFAFALGISCASAQQVANTTGDANAEIVRALSVTQDVALDFSTIALPVGNTAGTVVLATDGTTSGTFTPTGTPVAGAFTIDGPAAAVATITLPATGVNLTSGANTMVLDTFTSSAPTVTLTGGTGTFTVGGTLNIGASQALGAYTGTYAVQVDIP